MKLKECTMGKLVVTEDKEVGHIVGLTYNISIEFTGGMTNEEKFELTIPVVKFPRGERPIHHGNIKPF